MMKKKLWKILTILGVILLAGVLTTPSLAQDDEPETPGETLWYARYYNNTALSGDPVLSRNEVGLNYNWGDGSPADEVSDDNFSVRWTNYLNAPAGLYQFTVRSDDGVRVWVKDEWIIDEWSQHDTTTFIGYKEISGDQTEVVVEYFEAEGDADIELTWARIDANPLPDRVEQELPGETLWYARYYNNVLLSGIPVLTRSEVGLNYNWRDGSPAEGINADYFSARWSNILEVPDGLYQFTVRSDDGVRVWVENEWIIDAWTQQDTTTFIAYKTITGGQADVIVEYFELWGDADIELSWKLIDADAVPDPDAELESATLWPDSGPAGTVVNLSADGFTPSTTVKIGVGREGSEYDFVQYAVTSSTGMVSTKVVIPTYADPLESWVVAVETLNKKEQAVSNVFTVTEFAVVDDECGTTYTVRPGDTLDDIAEKCDTTLAALVGANPWIGDPGVLDVGWILYLPEEFEETPTAVLAPDSGSAGRDITLSVDGFVPYAPLNVALRSVDNTAASWADEVDANADGSIRIDVRIPASALPSEGWVVDVENPRTGITTTSNSFVVTE